MDMSSSTMAMAMPSSTASSSHMSGMDMGHESTGMTMVFFTATDTPLYSSAWTPTTVGQYAGICVFLIALSIIFRGLIALRCNALTLWAMWRRRQDTGILRLETDDFDGKKASQRPWRINEAAAIAILDMVLVGVSYLL
jgi:copper transporter 1